MEPLILHLFLVFSLAKHGSTTHLGVGITYGEHLYLSADKHQPALGDSVIFTCTIINKPPDTSIDWMVEIKLYNHAIALPTQKNILKALFNDKYTITGLDNSDNSVEDHYLECQDKDCIYHLLVNHFNEDDNGQYGCGYTLLEIRYAKWVPVMIQTVPVTSDIITSTEKVIATTRMQTSVTTDVKFYIGLDPRTYAGITLSLLGLIAFIGILFSSVWLWKRSINAREDVEMGSSGSNSCASVVKSCAVSTNTGSKHFKSSIDSEPTKINMDGTPSSPETQSSITETESNLSSISSVSTKNSMKSSKNGNIPLAHSKPITRTHTGREKGAGFPIKCGLICFAL